MTDLTPFARSIGTTARVIGLLCGGTVMAMAVQGCPDDCERKLQCLPSSGPGPGSGGQGGGAGAGGDGAGGGALLVDGEVCSSPSACESGFCADGVCCNMACDGVCESCDVVGAEGSCSADAADTDPADDCGLASCDGAGECAYAEHIWSRAFGGSNTDTLRDIAIDSAGNIYMIGDFYGTLTFGGTTLISAGSNDVFVVKLDPNGAPIWAKQFGDLEKQTGTAIAASPDGGVVVAAGNCGLLSFGGDTFDGSCGTAMLPNSPDPTVAKLDANGNHVWSFEENNEGGIGHIATDMSGNAYLAVGVYGFGNNPLARVRKVNGGGATVWAYVVAITNFARFSTLALTRNGEVWAAGSFEGIATFDTNTELTSSGRDIMLVHIDTGGSLLSVSPYGNATDGNFVSQVVLNSMNEPAIVGGLSGPMNFGGGDVFGGGAIDSFVAWFDAAGGHKNSIAVGGAGDDHVSDAMFASDDSLVIVGSSAGSVDYGGGTLVGQGQLDVIIAKFNQGGTHVWSRLYGTTGVESAAAMTLDTEGAILFGGIFDSTIDVGGGAIAAPSGPDLFLALLGP